MELKLKTLSQALPPLSAADIRMQDAVKDGVSHGLAVRQELKASAEASYMAAAADVDIDDLAG